MKLEKQKTHHKIPTSEGSDVIDVAWCGISHPKEPSVTLMMTRVAPSFIEAIIESHEGELPTGIPSYYAFVNSFGSLNELMVYPSPEQDMEVTGLFITRVKL